MRMDSDPGFGMLEGREGMALPVHLIRTPGSAEAALVMSAVEGTTREDSWIKPGRWRRAQRGGWMARDHEGRTKHGSSFDI